MTDPSSRSARSGVWIAIGAGLLAAALVIGLESQRTRFDGLPEPVLEIRVNGLSPRVGRDVLLPDAGWVLQIVLPEGLSTVARESLSVTLREERTSAIVDVTDRLAFRGNVASFVIPESLGLHEGLVSVRATLTDEQGKTLDAFRRTRVRSWLGGPPIGGRQVVHLDFGVDRSGDGRPDFHADLERFGLATPGRPELARRVADRIARRALARIERAYDAADDPNGTGLPRDPVRVRFTLDPEPSRYLTRICVGGRNPSQPGSVGYVRFDAGNRRKRSNECDGDPVSGVFPAELAIYEDSPLFRELLAPFRPADGGLPIGTGPGDEAALEAVLSDSAAQPRGDAPQSTRGRSMARAFDVFGDVLGTILAHESAHALGLVAGGRPGVGLFGSNDETSEHYAHNLDAQGWPESTPWLMNAGGGFDFESLAGLGEAGELRFRPLNYAYLRDRVVLTEHGR